MLVTTFHWVDTAVVLDNHEPTADLCASLFVLYDTKTRILRRCIFSSFLHE